MMDKFQAAYAAAQGDAFQPKAGNLVSIVKQLVKSKEFTDKFKGLALSLTRVRRVILRLTGMGCMTWQGMCGSGVGIGMGGIRVARSPTHVVPHTHQARTVCFGAAVGTAGRTTAGRRIAATLTRRSAATSSGSAQSCPQVSELKSESKAVVAERVERATPACAAGARLAECAFGKREAHAPVETIGGARTFLSATVRAPAWEADKNHHADKSAPPAAKIRHFQGNVQSRTR